MNRLSLLARQRQVHPLSFHFHTSSVLPYPDFTKPKLGKVFAKMVKKLWLGKTVPFHTSFGKPFHQTSYRVEDPLS